MKAEKAIYLSYRDSFSKDFYMPSANVVAAPVVMTQVDDDAGLALLTGDQPPQNVIFRLDAHLSVLDANGAPLMALSEALRLCTRTVPILYLHNAETVEPLTALLDFHRVADAILCTAYRDREVLLQAYRKMPHLRGMLDCRGVELPGDIASLSGELVSHGAVMAMLEASACTRRNVHVLQQRFIHVICDDSNGIAEAAARGVNGILTSCPAACYSLYEKFPANSFLRMRNLFAHKGFQNNGMYSENTVTGVRAAGEYGFDGAEIDVKLTSDLVPIVMHNLNTKGLFDCEEKVIEQTPYQELADLRRIGFENEGVDRFDDLMARMKEFPDTPVLIELKPNAIYHRVEELTAQTAEILSRPASQQNCICIMGALQPGLDYVHAHIPALPLAHCETVKLAPPQNRSEAEDRLCRLAILTAGWAAGYNPEDVMINRTFNEYAKMRGVTVFPWSRSWTLAPSRWEENGRSCDTTYLAGYDAWTTDHGDMYLHLPVSLELSERFCRNRRAGDHFRPLGVNCYRDRSHTEVETELLVLEGTVVSHSDGSYSAPSAGVAKVMLMERLELHFDDHFYIFSEPFTIRFE